MFDLFNVNDTADFEFIQSQIGTDIYINRSVTPTRVVITNTNLNSGYDDKKITSLSPIHRGDIVVYEGNKYMLISEINTERYNKYKGIIRRLPQTIIVNSSCRFIHVDCYITVGDLGVTSGKVITVADGSINVFTNNYYKELGLEIGNRFFVDGQMFKITGIDTFSQKGIANLSCDKDQINKDLDDVPNGIAGGKACPVDITNPATSILIGNTLQLAWTSTNSVPVVFESSSPSIATVSVTGLVTGISEGTCSIKVSNATNGFIYDTVAITVYAPEVYTMNLYNSTNDHDLVYGESIVIDKHVYLNGSTVSQSVTYSLVYSDQTTAVPSTLATISVDGSNVATVTNANTGTAAESIYVKAVLDIDNTVVSYYALTLDFQVAVSKSITITPNSATYVDIVINKNKVFTANVYSGTVESPEDVAWQIFADDMVSAPDTTTYQVTSQTTTQIAITALKVTKYIQLKCYLVSDPSVYTWQRIRLKPLY